MNTEDRPMRRSGLRLITGAALTAILAISVAGAALAGPGQPPPSFRTDAFTRDQVTDGGFEPNPNGMGYLSPDIRVCQTAIMCAADQPLIVGSTAYIFVNVNVPGPYGSGVSNGTLYLYSTLLGGAASWPGNFNLIGSVSLPASPGVTTVTIPWVNVPDDGPGWGTHYCLYTRWVSPTDPMVFEGPNALANVVANNNIAWHNVAPIGPIGGGIGTTVPFALGNVAGIAARNDLVFADPANRNFAEVGGTVVVDLGQELFQRWQQAGAQGTAIRRLGGTKIQILDLTRARIAGITVNPAERPQVHLTFTAPQSSSTTVFPVTVAQIGPAQAGAEPTDIGGVRYDVTVGQG